MADEDQKVDDIKVDDATESKPATANDEIEVVVTGEGDDAPAVIEPQEGIEELKRSFEEQKRLIEQERQARAQAEQLAYQAQMHAQQQFRAAQAATYQSVHDAIVFMKARGEALQKEWVEAKSMGDFQKEAELQREIMMTAQSMERLEDRKTQLEGVLRQEIQPVQPPRNADPIEAWADTLTPRSADWVRKHKDRFSTDEGRDLVAAAHYKALGSGLRQDSDAYFEAVETELGMRKPARQRVVDDEGDDADGVMSAAAAPARRSAPPPPAPVSRGGTRKGVVTLTADEREAAEISGISYEEYARNKEREKKRAR